MTEAGRPVLVGTTSVEKSEVLAEMLKRRGIKHEVLNAKFHEKEAPIVAQAGRTAAVTIATNMAGRGTDILLGGNPAGIASADAAQAWHQPRRGADRRSTRRRSTRPRPRSPSSTTRSSRRAACTSSAPSATRRAASTTSCAAAPAGRATPGSSRFYLSLEDTLMKRFASDRVAGLMERMGLEGDVALESRLVSRTIESAQTRVEGYNFDIRKRVVEYDDVINKQRETIYAERDKVLRNEDLTETVRDVRRRRAGGAGRRARSPEPTQRTGTSTASPTRSRRWASQGDATSIADGSPTSAVREEILEHLREARRCRARITREAATAPRSGRRSSGSILLRTIDQLWVDHLTELDDMRRGIGLRGYGGIDPLNEFKREAFKLYEELRGFISKQVANTIFRVQVTAAPQQRTDLPDASARAVQRDEHRRQRLADGHDHAGRGRPRPCRWHVPRRRSNQPTAPAAVAAAAAAGLRRRGGAARPRGATAARHPATSTATSRRRAGVSCRGARERGASSAATTRAGAAAARSSSAATELDARTRPDHSAHPRLGGRASTFAILADCRLQTADAIRWGALVRSDLPSRLTEDGQHVAHRPRRSDDHRPPLQERDRRATGTAIPSRTKRAEVSRYVNVPFDTGRDPATSGAVRAPYRAPHETASSSTDSTSTGMRPA